MEGNEEDHLCDFWRDDHWDFDHILSTLGLSWLNTPLSVLLTFL